MLHSVKCFGRHNKRCNRITEKGQEVSHRGQYITCRPYTTTAMFGDQKERYGIKSVSENES